MGRWIDTGMNRYTRRMGRGGVSRASWPAATATPPCCAGAVLPSCAARSSPPHTGRGRRAARWMSRYSATFALLSCAVSLAAGPVWLGAPAWAEPPLPLPDPPTATVPAPTLPALLPERRGMAPRMGRYDRRERESTAAGPARLHGQVREKGTGKPLGHVAVRIPRLGAETVTDAQGGYRLDGLPVGQHELEVASGEHRAQVVVVTLVRDADTEHDIRLERTRYGVYRATAEGPPPPGEMARRALGADEIQRIPGVYGDALKVVQNLPGVARPSPLGGEIVVRGSAPGDTSVTIEGVPVPILYHFGGLYSVLNTDLLEAIDFLPGGQPARWGRSLGGVLDARLAVPRAVERWSGYVESNFFHTGFFAKGPLGPDTTLSLAARRSYLDVLLDAAVPKDVLPFTLAPRYYDWQIALDHRFGARTSLTLLGFGSDDAMKLVFADPPEGVGGGSSTFEYGTVFAGGLAVLRHQAPTWHSTSTLGVVWSGAEFNLLDFIRFGLDTIDVTLRHDATIGRGPVRLRAGLDVFTSTTWYDALAPLGRTTSEGPGGDEASPPELATAKGRLTRIAPGVWYDAVLEPRPGVQFVPGLRLDLTRGMDTDEVVVPRLNARWRLDAQWTLKGAVGASAQPPALFQVHTKFGTPTLGNARGFEVAGGLEWKPTPVDDLDIQLFHKRLGRLVVQTPGLFPATPYQDAGEGRVTGLEVLARHRLAAHWFGWLAYTLQQATRTDHPGEPERRFAWDQTHVLTAVASYHLPRHWEVGARFRVASGNPQTATLGAVWAEANDSWQPQPSRCVNCDRLPAFHQLDVRIDKRWVYDSWMLNLYLDVQNVYNRANPEAEFWNFDYSQRTWLSGLPTLPSLGVRADF
ncbi:MAG: TonB-dependent receptor [Myxococcales bacterium]|nr:TonB-dependent receptor [Myxococcales bacterium]